MDNISPPSSPRVRPRVWLGIAAFLAYLAVFYTIWIINGIDYSRVGESEETLLTWYVAPLSGGLVVIVLAVSIFGWWRPSLGEKWPLSVPALVLPALMAVVAILNLAFGDISRVTTAMWLYLVVGSLLVGSLLHLPNAFFGLGSIAILQVLIQFGLGSVYYLARRFSGSLVPAMVLHGLWDFSTFSSDVPYAGLAAPFIGVSAVVVVVVLLRRDKRGVVLRPTASQ